jgi:hypothetical protein
MTKEVVEQGTRYLGASLGQTGQGTAFTRILALKTAPGWHVQGKTVKEWRFVGITEQEKTVFFYGPLESGTTLEEVLALPLPKALPFLARLAESLALLSERSVPWFPLQTDAILFTAGDGVLFLPPPVFQELRDLRPFEQNRDTWEYITHPDLKGESRASFSIASMLYRVITGRFPISGADAEEIHEQARKLDILPPARVVPELLPEISALVMAGLGRARRGPVKMDEWASELEAWKAKRLYRVLGAEEKEKAEREGQAVRQQSERGFRRRVFWQKNWKLIAIIAAVVIVVGIVGGSMAKNILAPRVTRGFTPQKVVQAFYTAMNTMDQTTMEACVVNHAGQGEVNEVTTLYVTSRVVLGYEGKSNVVSAADWDAQGRPDLVSPETLYGVTALSVTQEQGEPNPVFLAKYDKWNPAPPTDTAAAPDLNAIPQSEGHSMQDRVFLRKDKGDWVIYKIDRLQSNPLPAPKSVAAPPVSPSQQLLPMGGQ